MKRVLLLAMIVCAGAVQAQDCASFDAEGYRSIRTTNEFSTGPVGDSASTPRSQLELRCILQRPDATRVLEDLVTSSTLEGRLLALSGLYLVDRSSYMRRVIRYKKDRRIVTYTQGCIMRPERVADVISALERGAVWKLVQSRVDVPEHLNFDADRFSR